MEKTKGKCAPVSGNIREGTRASCVPDTGGVCRRVVLEEAIYRGLLVVRHGKVVAESSAGEDHFIRRSLRVGDLIHNVDTTMQHSQCIDHTFDPALTWVAPTLVMKGHVPKTNEQDVLVPGKLDYLPGNEGLNILPLAV